MTLLGKHPPLPVHCTHGKRRETEKNECKIKYLLQQRDDKNPKIHSTELIHPTKWANTTHMPSIILPESNKNTHFHNFCPKDTVHPVRA